MARKMGLYALATLLAVISVAILSGPFATPQRAVHAANLRGNEPWLMINCIQTEVEEGESFWLEVQKKYKSEWPHETMRVFWYTEEINRVRVRLRTSRWRATGQQRVPVQARQDGTRVPHKRRPLS